MDITQVGPDVPDRKWGTDTVNLTNYRLVIASFPHIAFFCQSVNIPGLTLPIAEVPSPFSRVPLVGDHLAFENLTVSIALDEGMKNYAEMLRWLVGAGFPESYDQRATLEAERVRRFGLQAKPIERSNADLQIFNNQKNLIRTFRFIDMHPVTLGSVEFRSTEADVPAPQFNVVFAYQYFQMSAGAAF